MYHPIFNSYPLRPEFKFGGTGRLHGVKNRCGGQCIHTSSFGPISGNQTVFDNNSVATITVITDWGNYDTYKWTPATNLYLNWACNNTLCGKYIGYDSLCEIVGIGCHDLFLHRL